MPVRVFVLLLSLVIASSVAACGASAAPSGSPAAVHLGVSSAWARAKPAGGTSAAYLTVTNGTSADDMLVGVAAPSVTSSASLHETTTDASGMTGMKHTDGVPIPAGKTVTLEPGGYHIMLMDLTRELKVGDTVDLVLTFQQAGPVNVTAEVRAN